ncbi:hypothetical protein GCM10025866_08170 [Naasia aerilata]|uniref:Uncharacterized protein n=1 Tax=Naasia aerilata TaxID=1162966 RepID=A0ABN6XJ25_9MICO|nr:hypothetical protein GCM10025866_08170 [Naasia aerilata]
MPPSVQRLWVDGSGPKRRPWTRAAACRSASTTPGCTRAVRATGSISSTRFRWRLVSTIHPAPTALPATEVPPPRAVSGVRVRRASSTIATTSASEAGKSTACGTTR